jgi:multicomponent Na+:H+ antiporter subunit F
VITVLLVFAVFLALLIAGNFIRVLRGPTVFDRLLGVGVIGTNAVLLLATFGFIYGRPEGFLDLAVTYAILNFIGVVAIAKFLDPSPRHRRRDLP